MLNLEHSALLQTFMRCGLNATQSVIIEDLIQRGESTAGSISLRTKLKRSTVYSALEQLEESGLIVRGRHGSVKRFSTIDIYDIPKVLKFHGNRNFETLQLATENLQKQLKIYSQVKKQNIGNYEITSYESRKKTEDLFQLLSSLGNYCSLYNLDNFSSGKWVKLMINVLDDTAISKPLIKELIFTDSDPTWYVSKIRNPNHHVKYINFKDKPSTDFTVIDNTVILNSYEEGREVSLHIRHTGYVQLMQSVFDKLWENALPSANSIKKGKRRQSKGS